LHPLSENGTIAQLVEQRTENPCVPGSIPGGTTYNKALKHNGLSALLFLKQTALYLNHKEHYHFFGI
jgi:hypothetical protein